ncbi:WD40 repeat domain-containing protein [Nocardia sp. NPDC055053]
MSFSPDGRRIASLFLDSYPWLWDISTSPARGTALGGDEDFVSTVGFSADGHRLITVAPTHFASGDTNRVEETGNVFANPLEMTPSAVRLWNTDTGEPAGPPIISRGGLLADLVEKDDEAPIAGAAISPDGQRIPVSTAKALRLHDAATGQPIDEPWIDTEGGSHGGAVAFSPDGTYAVAANIKTSELQLREVQTGRPVGNPMTGHTGAVLGLAFTAHGSHIVSRGADDGWMLWPGPNKCSEELCDELIANMTRAEWDEWVSPTIDYRAPCPMLDVPD